MQKGVVLGGYQISNILIAALLVSSVAGLGVSTDSFSGITDSMSNILPSNSVSPDNQTDQNNTDNQGDSDQGTGGQDSDQNNQNSENNDSPGGNTDTGQNTGSDNGTGTGTPIDGNNTQDVVNETEQTVNETTGNQTDGTTGDTNETTSGTNDTTEGTVQIPAIYTPEAGQVFDTATPTLDIIFNGDNASYKVDIDGQTEVSGRLDGQVTINQQVRINASGIHQLSAIITRDGKILHNRSRTFTIKSSAIQETKNGFYLTENMTAGESTLVQLYDNGALAEGRTVYLDSNSIGTTDQNGEITFTVPDQQEVTLSADNPDVQKTFSVEGYTSELSMSFSFSKTLYQGRQNTLTVTSDGRAVNNATVYANGVPKGQTDSSGQITFTIPEQDSVTIKAVKNNSESNKTFTAEVPPIRISVTSPSEGQDFSSYKASFNLEINSSSQGTVDISVDGASRLSRAISSGQNIISEDITIENSGNHTFTISVSNQKETVTKTGAFSTSEDVPPPSIFIDTPTEGQSIGDSRAGIQASFDSIDPFSYNISVDGREIETGSLPTGTPSISTTAYCLPRQQHQLVIKATSQDTGRTSSKTITFETTGTPPAVAKDNSKPTRGDTLQSPVTFNYTVVGCQDSVSYDVYVEQGGSLVQTIDSGTLSKYEKVKAPDTSFSLSSGDYTFVMEGQNQISLSFSVQ